MTPALFVSHGAPTVAIEEDDDYVRALREFGSRHPRPRSVVVVSAHWEAGAPPRVTSSPRPAQVYDFAGFPVRLFHVKYGPPGDPELAREIAKLLPGAEPDAERGLDHGVWVPLRFLYPEADVPVVAVSLPPWPPEKLASIGRALAPLRSRGVLLVGSGGIVHNLRRLIWSRKHAPVELWAAEFDDWVAGRLERGEIDALADYRHGAPNADKAVPTVEHFHPLFVVLGSAAPGERVSAVFRGFHYGNLSMSSFAFGV